MGQSATEMRDRFWSELSEVRTGLLGLAGGDGHAQPMTAHFDRPGASVWFIARADSPLAKGSAEARFHYAGKGHDFFACVGGRLSPDAEALDRYWTPEVSRWFASKTDATALRFDLKAGETWIPGTAVDGVEITFG